MLFANKNFSCLLIVVFFHVCIGIESHSWAQESPKVEDRVATPSKQAQREKLKVIRGLYQELFGSKSIEQQRTLAEKLLGQGIETQDDEVSRYVLLNEALERAKKTGHSEVAWKALEAITKHFEVEQKSARLDLLGDLCKTERDPMVLTDLINRCKPMLVDDIENDRFEEAAQFTRKLVTISRKGATEVKTSQLEQSLRQLKTLHTGFKSIQDDLESLAADDSNKEANRKVGRFYCLLKGDFEKGLDFLLKGDNEELRKLAALDRNSSRTWKETLALANTWWELGEKESSLASKIHAAEFYATVIDKTQGITQKQIETRMSEVRPTVDSRFARLFENKWKFAWKEVGDWEVAVFHADGTLSLKTSGKLVKRRWRFVDDSIFIETSKVIRIFIESDRFVAKKYANNLLIDESVGVVVK